MSFLRHKEIYQSDERVSVRARPRGHAHAHRLDEFPVGYSLASCSPAGLASASPTGLIVESDQCKASAFCDWSGPKLNFLSHERSAPQTSTRLDACKLSATIHIPADAQVGETALWVVDGNEKLLGIARFFITPAISPGQIPPGIEPPAVDVMWSVVPKKLVGHNFGKSLAENYYAVEIIIGNNSAYNLQIVSVGFELPADQDLKRLLARNLNNQRKQRSLPPKFDKDLPELDYRSTDNVSKSQITQTILPTSSYRLTRGSLEARQLNHPRTLVISTITALGPLFTGFVPFFNNVNRRANFSEGVNIFKPIRKRFTASMAGCAATPARTIRRPGIERRTHYPQQHTGQNLSISS